MDIFLSATTRKAKAATLQKAMPAALMKRKIHIFRFVRS
jgi:hypothetical protein